MNVFDKANQGVAVISHPRVCRNTALSERAVFSCQALAVSILIRRCTLLAADEIGATTISGLL